MKAITQIDEMGLLAGSSDVDGTAVEHGIVGNDPNHPSIHPGETRNDSLAETGLNLKYRPFVNDHADQLAHVVRLAAIERNDRCKRLVAAVDRVVAISHRRQFRSEVRRVGEGWVSTVTVRGG